MVLGSHWATYGIHSDEFEPKIKLKQGKNIISLLSVTVGLQVLLLIIIYIPYDSVMHKILILNYLMYDNVCNRTMDQTMINGAPVLSGPLV